MKWINLLVCVFIMNGITHAQLQVLAKTEIYLQLPEKFSQRGASVTVRIDGITKSFMLNERTSKLTIPAVDSSAKLSIEYSMLGFSAKSWEGSFKLIGSDKAEIILEENGDISVKQWPKIEFECASGRMQVFINESLDGETSVSKTLEPNKEHIIKWKKDGQVTCIKKINLSYNQKRKLTCNSDNSITED